ncbi:MAG: glycosyltransferase family 39 protein [Deltaproteobacteria bacterium]|nr:glycosyltransferase family 39 protein [Deltaproteobacteria bacterium]
MSMTGHLLPMVLLRAVAVVAGIAAAIYWRAHEPGYGWLFWGWVICLAAYIGSFPPALRRERPIARPAWVLFVGILGLAAVLRFPDIYSVPGNISIDELLPGLEALHITQGGKPNVFGSIGWFTIPNLTFAIPAVIMQLTPLSPFHALRLSSALTGLAGILSTFLLCRRLLGTRAALATSFFMSVGFWHLHNSRTGFPYPQSSFGPSLVLYLLVRAQQDHSRLLMAAAGVVCGLALQLYFPVRILLLLCPLFMAGDWMSVRLSWRGALQQSAIFSVGVLLALAPLVASVPLDSLTMHSRDVLITRPAVRLTLERRYAVTSLQDVVAGSLAEATRMFTQWADVAVLNRSPQGLLDRGTLAMLLAGVVLVLLQGRAYPLLLLLWGVVTLLFGVALSDAPRASYRLAAAMPAIYMLAGFAVDRALQATEAPQRWYRLTIRPLILLALAAWVAHENYQSFFERYSRDGDGKLPPWPAAMRFLASQCDGRRFYFVPKADLLSESETLDLFCSDHSAIEATDIPQRVDTSRPATFIVMAQQFATLNLLNRCYPTGHINQHQGPNGLPLFTSMDVDIPALLDGPKNCQTPRPTEDGSRQPT